MRIDPMLPLGEDDRSVAFSGSSVTTREPSPVERAGRVGIRNDR